MSALNPTALADLKAQLQQRRAELREEVAQAHRGRDADAPPLGEVGDQKDEALRLALSEVADAEQQRDLDELALVEAALQRVDDGRYGLCADCAEPIALARLHAQPAALRCAACQGAAEHRRP